VTAQWVEPERIAHQPMQPFKAEWR
jgi:hypothetical protein